MPSDVKRATRVAEGLREELSALLLRDVRDPRLAGVLVSRVTIGDDLRQARVFVRLLQGGEDATRRDDAMAGLLRAGGMLRREVTKRLGLRHSPELKFHYDEGQDHVDRIEQLLQEVRKDGKND